MARSYTLKRRAEAQADTRRRIVEAAVELHSSLGPARTSLSQVAERAGVQRNTLYAHFPDERALAMACSALSLERTPPPQAQAWRGLGGLARLRTGLAAVYGWYARHPELIGCVVRDAEHHEITREVTELRLGPVVRGWREVLGEGLSAGQEALLRVALGYGCWRSLAVESGLGDAAAAELMARAIEAV